MPQEEATSHLVVAMSDKSSTVRITAIQASGNRPASSSLTEKMKDLVLKDSVTQVRAEALGYFADKVGSDQALRPILQKVANSDPDPQIREAALNALNQ
jgi:hypothetical protein